MQHPDTFIKTQSHCYEGYWRDCSKSDIKRDPDEYPFPIPNKVTPKQLPKFIKKLQYVEENYTLLGGIIKNYDGYSGCRLCAYTENGSYEYSIPYNNDKICLDDPSYITWPEGLLHYFIEHNVIPSREFYDFIMTIEVPAEPKTNNLQYLRRQNSKKRDKMKCRNRNAKFNIY